jgi:hypothetical protein
MCRYGYSGPYKRHFACFNCRKAFKQPPIEDYFALQGRGHLYRQLAAVWADKSALAELEQKLGVRIEDLRTEFHGAERKCPECGGLMADLGLDFKPPKQTDVRAWKAIAGMYRTGHAWQTCGCNGPGWIPASQAEYKQYLANRKTHYELQLKYTQDAVNLEPNSKRQAYEFWAAQIQAVEKELAAV